jgi:hypothetical protein
VCPTAIQGTAAPKLFVSAAPVATLNKSVCTCAVSLVVALVFTRVMANAQTLMQLGHLPPTILLPLADAAVIGMFRSCLADGTALVSNGIPKAPCTLAFVP